MVLQVVVRALSLNFVQKTLPLRFRNTSFCHKRLEKYPNDHGMRLKGLTVNPNCKRNEQSCGGGGGAQT